MTDEEYARANERTMARGKVTYAVNKGVLVRPSTCGDCGEYFPKIIAHHEDYSKPLDVAWVCKPCHLKRHSHSTSLWDKEAMRFIETANYENMDYKACEKIKEWLEVYADNKNISTGMLMNYIIYKFMKTKIA